MRNLFIFIALVSFVSCGNDVSIVEKFKTQDFEGYYFCDNNSSLELLADFKNRVSFETSGQSLNSINPQNDTLGTHPTISERDLLMVNNKLIINPRNYNYSSSTHDLEEDVNGSNITGNRRTDIQVKMVTSDQLKLTIEVFSGAVNNNVNNIVLKREITCNK